MENNFINKDIEKNIFWCVECNDIYKLADDLAKEQSSNLLLYKTQEWLHELFVKFLNEKTLEDEIKVYFSKNEIASWIEDNKEWIIEYCFLIKLYTNFTPETFQESFKLFVEDYAKENF